MFELRKCPHCNSMEKQFNHGMFPEIVNEKDIDRRRLKCQTGYTCKKCGNDWNEIIVYSIKYEYTEVETIV